MKRKRGAEVEVDVVPPIVALPDEVFVKIVSYATHHVGEGIDVRDICYDTLHHCFQKIFALFYHTCHDSDDTRHLFYYTRARIWSLMPFAQVRTERSGQLGLRITDTFGAAIMREISRTPCFAAADFVSIVASDTQRRYHKEFLPLLEMPRPLLVFATLGIFYNMLIGVNMDTQTNFCTKHIAIGDHATPRSSRSDWAWDTNLYARHFRGTKFSHQYTGEYDSPGIVHRRIWHHAGGVLLFRAITRNLERDGKDPHISLTNMLGNKYFVRYLATYHSDLLVRINRAVYCSKREYITLPE